MYIRRSNTYLGKFHSEEIYNLFSSSKLSGLLNKGGFSGNLTDIRERERRENIHWPNKVLVEISRNNTSWGDLDDDGNTDVKQIGLEDLD